VYARWLRMDWVIVSHCFLTNTLAIDRRRGRLRTSFQKNDRRLAAGEASSSPIDEVLPLTKSPLQGEVWRGLSLTAGEDACVP